MFWSIKLIILIIQSELNKGILYFITSQVLFESLYLSGPYMYTVFLNCLILSESINNHADLLNDVNMVTVHNHFIPLILLNC